MRWGAREGDWVLNTQGRVLNTRKPCQDAVGNSVDPNVRVAVAVENKDGIDGHRHTPPPGGGGVPDSRSFSVKGSTCCTEVALPNLWSMRFELQQGSSSGSLGPFDRDSAEFNVHGQFSFSALERSFHS